MITITTVSPTCTGDANISESTTCWQQEMNVRLLVSQMAADLEGLIFLACLITVNPQYGTHRQYDLIQRQLLSILCSHFWQF